MWKRGKADSKFRRSSRIKRKRSEISKSLSSEHSPVQTTARRKRRKKNASQKSSTQSTKSKIEGPPKVDPMNIAQFRWLVMVGYGYASSKHTW